MPTSTPRGRKPLPTPGAQSAQLPIYPKRRWDYSGLERLPPPHATGWPLGYVPPEIQHEMMRHPKVNQAINNLKSAILGGGGRVVPCVHPSDENWELALELAKVCEHSLRHIRGSWHATARQLLDAVRECHKVAAKSFREETRGTFAGYWLPDTLQILPNVTFRFLRDATGDVVKLEVRVYGDAGGAWQQFERVDFAVLSFRPVDGSIWGSTALDPAYESFYKDVQLDPEEMAMVAQFGRGTVVVIAPGRDANGMLPPDVPVYNPDLTPKLDDNGEQIRMPLTEDIAVKMQSYEAGSIVVLPGDSKFQIAEAQNGGEVFARMHEANERRIASAIMGTDQLTESRNQLSSDNKGIAQDVAGLGIMDGKRALEEMVENDIFTDIVRYNFGESALDLLPIFDLGSGQNGRLVGLMNAVSGFVNNGAFDQTQWWYYCVEVGLPLPDPKAKPLVDTSRATAARMAIRPRHRELLDMKDDFAKISDECEQLRARVELLEDLVARCFGHMAEAREPTVRLASNQATSTIKGWRRERRKQAGENSR